MKLVACSLAAVALSLVSVVASADETASAPKVYTTPVVTVYGRPNKPSVVIELTRPTAASAARSAHEEMRNAWLEKSVPATLKQ